MSLIWQYLINNHDLVVIFGAGIAGGLIADILNDNCLELPKVNSGKFYMGFLGGTLIGGFAGLLIDGSFITAFMGGFMGKEVIGRLVSIEKNTAKK